MKRTQGNLDDPFGAARPKFCLFRSIGEPCCGGACLRFPASDLRNFFLRGGIKVDAARKESADRSEDAMVAGVMAGHAAKQRALETAFRFGCSFAMRTCRRAVSPTSKSLTA